MLGPTDQNKSSKELNTQIIHSIYEGVPASTTAYL